MDTELFEINNTETNGEKVSLTDQFKLIMDTIVEFKKQILVLQNHIKLLEKNVKKDYKNLEKEVEKNKMKGNKKPSGFAKPTKITDELCKFMNQKEGTEIARTDVTKALHSYIEKNNLQNDKNKKEIIPDKKLKNLLGIEETDDVILTYFNIQKYMNKHFINKKGNIKKEEILE